MATPPPTIIAANDIACRRAGRMVFRGLSFRVGAGECLIVRGRNGSGKSSLLRQLAGLLPVAEGEIRDRNEQPIGNDLAAWRRQISWLGHHDGLKPGETPAQAIAFRMRLNGTPGDAAGTLKAMAMQAYASTQCRLLSAGQRRRVALAGVMASGGPLWLIDEPTTALDNDGAALFWKALEAHTAGGGAAIITTHDTVPHLHSVGTMELPS